MTHSYLKDWIDRKEAGVKGGTAGAVARLAAAITLQKELKQILEGEAPYDIFVRRKPPDFMGGRAFTGERWNDLHYTLSMKSGAHGGSRLAATAGAT